MAAIIATSTIIGIVAIGAAVVATFIVYLVLTGKQRPKGQRARGHHNLLPDMHWYKTDPDLYDALFMTFGVGLWIGSSLPQLVTNATTSNSAERESVDPFFITLIPPALAGKIPGFRHVLARNIASGVPNYAITVELVGIFLGMAAFIIWMFQYAVPLYQQNTDMALASSLIGIATFYAIAWVWLVYWVQSIHHHVESKTTPNDSTTTTSFAARDDDDEYDPFEGSELGVILELTSVE